MKTISCLLLGLALGATSCQRESENPAAPATPAASSSGPAGAAGPAPPAATSRPVPLPGAPAPENVPADVALQHLNTALRNYYAEKFELPATIDDLYVAGYLKQRFKAPDGKEFVINRTSRSVEVKP